MQDRYVGDVGDFGKYGLLRALCERVGLKLGVIWYYTNPTPRELERNANDGRHIGYLDLANPEEPSAKFVRMYKNCDPELYDALRKIVGSTEGREERRKLVKVEDEGRNILPKQTVFFRDLVPETDERSEWAKRARESVACCNVVFLDPDNGLWIESEPASKKHVLKEELKCLLDDPEKSVIVYQHANRATGGVQNLFVKRKRDIEDLGRKTVLGLWFHRGTARVYFIIPSKHKNHFAPTKFEEILDCWMINKHFTSL